ncbi:hypothetical protein [Paenibacillus sp. ISL-20]|uniref:hypothetical protein n=1 Tax=Paenibacillus sp. ISL-20 TaxID=2819163 RepID=UPI001BE6453E|nr:hypothetical protein [Paenibacillus sp. ISL-20]MBT2763521.1 hypothetical protein [Paenibacillus sp. ISL-20]
MDSFLRNEYVFTLMGMGLFQLWAYRAKKSTRVKLLPPIIAIILCLLLMVSNAAIIWVILLIPIMEVSLWSLLAVALIETGITFHWKQHAKLFMLIGMECVLIMIIFIVRRTM